MIELVGELGGERCQVCGQPESRTRQLARRRVPTTAFAECWADVCGECWQRIKDGTWHSAGSTK